ncbi:MAG: DUF6688 family protein [Saprospiraceae bacterium]|nr:DUF6688 family protein [Saprospiraceae bacterium]
MEIFLIGGIIFTFIFFFVTIEILKEIKEGANTVEITMGTLYIVSLILFAIQMTWHNTPYYIAIELGEFECYSPFSGKHALTLIFYFLAFNISMLLVWRKSNQLPPLVLTLSLIFIIIGVLISSVIFYQISFHNTETLDAYTYDKEINWSSDEVSPLFVFAPLFSIIIGVSLVFQVITKTINETVERTYSNKLLNALNTFLATKSRNPFWILVLMFPVFFIVTLILILFGQNSDSIVKVFTDTATWRLSQQVHPPFLDTRGHYLCTVAASGHPKIVKPLRIGYRNGREIIVNRQLLIANAFEEMIQGISPTLHRGIRNLYDKYGYNLSKKINTPFRSNLTYILMKPLEWVFLLSLYLLCKNPEKKINKQYAAK